MNTSPNYDVHFNCNFKYELMYDELGTLEFRVPRNKKGAVNNGGKALHPIVYSPCN